MAGIMINETHPFLIDSISSKIWTNLNFINSIQSGYITVMEFRDFSNKTLFFQFLLRKKKKKQGYVAKI